MTFFFKYFNFQIIRIQHSITHIYIYVYPYKQRVNFLIRYILYYEKSLLTKYFLRTVYGVTITKKTKLKFKKNRTEIKAKEKKILFFAFSLFFLVFKMLILK